MITTTSRTSSPTSTYRTRTWLDSSRVSLRPRLRSAADSIQIDLELPIAQLPFGALEAGAKLHHGEVDEGCVGEHGRCCSTTQQGHVAPNQAAGQREQRKQNVGSHRWISECEHRWHGGERIEASRHGKSATCPESLYESILDPPAPDNLV